MSGINTEQDRHLDIKKHPRPIRKQTGSRHFNSCTGKAEPYVVVPVARAVVVAIGRPTVASTVVPATTTINPV